MRVAVVVLLVAMWTGCKAKRTPVDPDFDAYEDRFATEGKVLAAALRKQGKTIDDAEIPTSYRTVFVGRGGVIVDRKIVAKLSELDAKRAEVMAAIAENVRLAPSFHMTPSVLLDIDAQPAATAVAVLRLFVGHEMLYSRPSLDERLAGDQFCSTTLRAERSKAAEAVQLSILVDPERTWVGLSRVLEFEEIPHRGGQLDADKLEHVLKERKASAFFADRSDAELGAGATTGEAVVTAFDAACKEGFVDLAVVPRDQLSAIPQL